MPPTAVTNYLFLNTRGTCLLCYNDCPKDVVKNQANTQKSVNFCKLLSRYLGFKIDNSIVTDVKAMRKCDKVEKVGIELCDRCTTLANAFCQVHFQVQFHQMILDRCVRTVSEVIAEGDKKAKTAMFSEMTDDESLQDQKKFTRFTYGVFRSARNLRKTFRQKCGTKLASSFPVLKLPRISDKYKSHFGIRETVPKTEQLVQSLLECMVSFWVVLSLSFLNPNEIILGFKRQDGVQSDQNSQDEPILDSEMQTMGSHVEPKIAKRRGRPRKNVTKPSRSPAAKARRGRKRKPRTKHIKPVNKSSNQQTPNKSPQNEPPPPVQSIQQNTENSSNIESAQPDCVQKPVCPEQTDQHPVQPENGSISVNNAQQQPVDLNTSYDAQRQTVIAPVPRRVYPDNTNYYHHQSTTPNTDTFSSYNTNQPTNHYAQYPPVPAPNYNYDYHNNSYQHQHHYMSWSSTSSYSYQGGNHPGSSAMANNNGAYNPQSNSYYNYNQAPVPMQTEPSENFSSARFRTESEYNNFYYPEEYSEEHFSGSQSNSHINNAYTPSPPSTTASHQTYLDMDSTTSSEEPNLSYHTIDDSQQLDSLDTDNMQPFANRFLTDHENMAEEPFSETTALFPEVRANLQLKVMCSTRGCTEAFASESQLELHALSHGSFKCNFCNLGFGKAHSLAAHEKCKHSKNQTAASKNKCPRCDFGPSTQFNYFLHFLSEHLQIPVFGDECVVCKKRFTIGTQTVVIQQHMKSNHDVTGVDPKLVFHCHTCQAPFLKKRQYTNHLQFVH